MSGLLEAKRRIIGTVELEACIAALETKQHASSDRSSHRQAGGLSRRKAARAHDRLAEETREEWLARRVGAPPPSSLTKVNERGETREQWLVRRQREMGMVPD